MDIWQGGAAMPQPFHQIVPPSLHPRYSSITEASEELARRVTAELDRRTQEILAALDVNPDKNGTPAQQNIWLRDKAHLLMGALFLITESDCATIERARELAQNALDEWSSEA